MMKARTDAVELNLKSNVTSAEAAVPKESLGTSLIRTMVGAKVADG